MTTETIHLPDEVSRRLNQVAEQSGRSKGDCIAEAVLEYVGDFEDYRIAAERAGEVRSGKSATVSLAEVRAGYDSHRQHGRDDGVER